MLSEFIVSCFLTLFIGCFRCAGDSARDVIEEEEFPGSTGGGNITANLMSSQTMKINFKTINREALQKE